ncbi:alpha-(1,3)-fucosyltransferase C-like isoform X2 [Mizuhopecten yessoensis]|nr:alpha-(1,3)-fucosyltransferase C-like isoform X2 [Mizuhopecten yessoensis]
MYMNTPRPLYPPFIDKTFPERIRVYYYNKPDWVSVHEFEGCEYKCDMTVNSKYSASAKAVIFHGPGLGRTAPKKSRGQIWIMHGLESPQHYSNDLSEWKNVFNWTFTYRRDSDILQTYSGFISVPTKISISNITELWKTKDRIAAWMVSHCHTHSKREKYANLLRKTTDIHVYGGCGQFKCPSSNADNCMGLLQKHYRYYLAFENSLCLDYVTEKGFKTYVYSPSTIPVMRGGSNYSLFFPPGSYINTNDFNTAENLGKAMNGISTGKNNFRKFFAWKQAITVDKTLHHKQWCSLCERIHLSENHTGLYSSIKNWLYDKPRSACKSPKDLGL